jgi:hypothetical protein
MKLIFGGPKLAEPSYTWFSQAITNGILHGPPGDEAIIVTKTEAAKWKAALYRGLPNDT